jgi:uncharacterized protein
VKFYWKKDLLKLRMMKMNCGMTSGLIRTFFMRSKRLPALIVIILLTLQVVVGQRATPEQWGLRVHDEANVLSAQTVQQLESQLKSFEDSTSNQIAILIISSLEVEAIEDYSLRIVESEDWKLGQKGKDNGVLLLVAIDDRKMRIEVGYGLEGVLTDALCSRIIRNEMAPNFRRGDYDAGVMAAAIAIMQAIGGEYVADEPASRKKGPGSSLITLLIIFGVIIFISRIRGGGGGSGWSSGTGWYGGGLGGRGSSSGGGFGGFSGGGGGFGGGGSSGSW